MIIIVRFHLRAKKAQVKALRKFARAMKWPNLVKVEDVLKEKDEEAKPLENRSSDTMSYFTGMILPGVTLPWLIMNSMIDCDDDAGSTDLAALTHMYPNSGFQYVLFKLPLSALKGPTNCAPPLFSLWQVLTLL